MGYRDGCLDGKAVLVTGAASGIGAATVSEIVRQGGTVVALDISPAVADLAEPGRVVALIGDAASLADIQRATDAATSTFGTLNGAVGVAAITRAGTVETMSLETWDEVMHVNLRSIFVLAKATVPAMRMAGGGALVAIASQVGLVGYPENVAYCAAKAGIINLIRAITIDHASQGIRANAVCPGPVDTPLLTQGFAQTGESYEVVTRRVPAGRVAQPGEIAATVGFLLSDQARFVTGAAWTVDGGYTAQ